MKGVRPRRASFKLSEENVPLTKCGRIYMAQSPFIGEYTSANNILQ